MDKLYTIWYNGDKVANHLTFDEVHQKQREIEDESWDAHIFIVTDKEDEEIDNAASSLIGKCFYYLNPNYGTVKSTPIIERVWRTNDDFHLYGRMYKDIISYYYVETLLDGGFIFAGGDSIQALSIDVLRNYVKNEKAKWEGMENQLNILEEMENSVSSEEPIDICGKNPHIGAKQTHKRA